MDELHQAPPQGHVVVMATTNQMEGVDLTLRRPGRFDKEVEVAVPSGKERREVSECVCVCVCASVWVGMNIVFTVDFGTALEGNSPLPVL